VRATDALGNPGSPTSYTWTVDTTAPTVGLDDPGAVLRGVVTLSGTATDANGVRSVRFERSPAGAGTWSTIDTDTSAPYTASFSTGAVADGYVDLRAVATDASGNVTFSPVATRLVDNTAPTATLATSATAVNSTSTLTVTATDTGTGIASVVLQRTPTGTSSWTTMATLTSAPYTAPFDAAGVPAGRYDVRALVTDNAGNVTTAVLTVTVGGSGLGVSLADPGRTLTGTVSLTATTSGVGATQVSFEIRREGAQAWTSLGADTSAPWSMQLDTTLLRDGRYDVQATVTDGAGSLVHDVRAGVAVDNTTPSITKSVPVAGGRLAGRTVTLTASEALNAVTHVSLDGSATAVPAIKGSAVSFTVGKLRPGRHVLRGTLTDAAGLTAPFSLRFTVPLSAKLGTPSRSRGNVAVPVTVSAKATVKARLVSPDGRVVSTRALTAPKGTVRVALPLPRGAAPGRWTVRVSASAGGVSVTTTAGFTVAANATGTWKIIGR
jgi:chitinase